MKRDEHKGHADFVSHSPHLPSLYIDLDGVLVDFQRGVCEVFREPWGSLEEYVDSGRVWKDLRARAPKFWESLEWHPEGPTLWARLKSLKPIVLTGVASGWADCAQQKRTWCRQRLGPNVPVLCVQRPEKKQYAVSTTLGYPVPNVLIDDNEKSIGEWNAAGGFGVLYRNNAVATALTVRSFVMPWH